MINCARKVDMTVFIKDCVVLNLSEKLLKQLNDFSGQRVLGKCWVTSITIDISLAGKIRKVSYLVWENV